MIDFLLGHSIWAFRSGELAFARGWPLWLLFGLAGAGLAAILFTLLRRSDLNLLQRGVIGLLQFAFLALALLLLWRPVLNVERIRDRENVVAVVIDNSGSMNAAHADEGSWREQAVRALQDSGALKQIAASSELRLFSFDERAQSLESLDAVPAGAGATRIGDALTTVTQMAASVPMAAVVLVSDGAENGGSLDEAQLARLSATGIPVHAIGVGPEQSDNDVELEQLQVPDSAVAGEMLRAVVSIRHQKQRGTRVRVYDGEKLVAAQEVPLPGKAGLTTVGVEFPAGEAGVRDLRVQLDAVTGEASALNNERRAIIDVDGRPRSVLYIEGEPRWEYKFMRRAAEGDRSLRIVSTMRATPNRYYRQGVKSGDELKDGLPATEAEMYSFDAIILGSIEAAAFSQEQHQWLKDYVDRRGGSLMLLAGRDGMGDGGWGRVPVQALLPARLPGGSTPGYGARSTKARLTPYGQESPVGRLDTDTARNDKSWAELPSLADFQNIGTLRPGAVVLLEAQSAQRSDPLLVWQRYGRGSTWLLATATTWRWQMRLPLEDQRHEMFWRQLLHALAAPAPSRLSLQAERTVYEDEGSAQIEAQVLDETFRPVPGALVSVTAAADSGAAAPVTVEPSGRDDGRYRVRVQASAPGMYRVAMTAKLGDRTLGEAETHLRRVDGVREQFGLYQHRPMLERLARETAGRYWTLDDLAGLPEAIRYSRAGMVERQTLDLWNMPLALLLLAALKLSEWLLRRHWKRL
jgi:muconolactone delta-isomerase